MIRQKLRGLYYIGRDFRFTHKVSLLAGVDTLLVLQDGAVALHGPRDFVIAELMKSRQGEPPPRPATREHIVAVVPGGAHA